MPKKHNSLVNSQGRFVLERIQKAGLPLGRWLEPSGIGAGTWIRWGEATAESVEIIWMRGEGLVIPGDSGREVCVRGTYRGEVDWITRELRKTPSGVSGMPLAFTVVLRNKVE